MKRRNYLIVIGLFFLSMYGQNAKQNIDRKYDIISEGNGVENTYLVKVWIYANKLNLKPETLRKYTVHEIIFKVVLKENAYLNFATIAKGTFGRVKISGQFLSGDAYSRNKIGFDSL